MKDSFRIYVHGLGAIGSAFAARIQESHPEWLSVILDPDRMKAYHGKEITVNNKPFPFHFVSPDTKADIADLVIIAVKYHQLTQSINAIKNFVGEKTIILSLLNGITSEEVIAKEYGTEKLLYSFVVGTDAVREGRSVEYSQIGKIVFGDAENRDSIKVQKVREIFDSVGIPYEVPESIMHALWWKFMLNVGVNQLSAVLRAPYGVFQKQGEAQQLMLDAFREVVLLSEKKGVNLNNTDMERAVAILKTLAPNGKTSMLQDIEAGRKTEVEIFAGTMIELGKQYGIPTPVNEMLWHLIRALEEMQTRSA